MLEFVQAAVTTRDGRDRQKRRKPRSDGTGALVVAPLVAGEPTPLDLRGRSQTVTVTYWDRTNKFCQLFNAFDLTDVSGMKRTAEYRRRVLATKR